MSAFCSTVWVLSYDIEAIVDCVPGVGVVGEFSCVSHFMNMVNCTCEGTVQLVEIWHPSILQNLEVAPEKKRKRSARLWASCPMTFGLF